MLGCHSQPIIHDGMDFPAGPAGVVTVGVASLANAEVVTVGVTDLANVGAAPLADAGMTFPN